MDKCKKCKKEIEGNYGVWLVFSEGLCVECYEKETNKHNN